MSNKNIIKKSIPKKDIGNLNNKEFGCELDPNKKLCLTEDKDKGQQAYYKGSKMKYEDVIDELEERVSYNGSKSIGSFAGFGKGTLNKK